MRIPLQAVVVAAALLAGAPMPAATWIRGDLPIESVFQIAAHPTLPGIAFAATASGVYRTTDAGSHWNRVTELDLSEFAFNPFLNSEVCALVDGFRATTEAYGYCSDDLGLTWKVIPGAGINFLLFDRRVPNLMYSGVGYGNSWIFVSNDHGLTWNVRGYTSGHPNFHGWAASDLDSTIYVTSYPHGGPVYAYWTQPLYRSRDFGVTWDVIGAPSAWTVVSDAAHRSTLYGAFDYSILPLGAQRDYTILATTDGGTTWETRGVLRLDNSYIQVLAGYPANAAVVYASGDSGAVYQSLDGGRTWKRIDDDMIHEAPMSAGSFEIDRPHSMSVGIDGTVYAATRNAVFAMTAVARGHAVRRK